MGEDIIIVIMICFVKTSKLSMRAWSHNPFIITNIHKILIIMLKTEMNYITTIIVSFLPSSYQSPYTYVYIYMCRYTYLVILPLVHQRHPASTSSYASPLWDMAPRSHPSSGNTLGSVSRPTRRARTGRSSLGVETRIELVAQPAPPLLYV